ncbi:MAG: M48 family metallopeptidase [Clostridiales bacterium]|nr:M48 family metallopeptidase [Clostridiales bacterium]
MVNNIPYTIIRSNRKTCALYVTEKATVEVRAPMKMSKPAIERFVASKENWLRTNLAWASARLAECASFKLDYGSSIILLGKEHTIKAAFGNKISYGENGIFVPPGLNPDEIKHAVVLMYKAAAKDILTIRTGQIAEMMGVKPAVIKISSAKTRWGSCSGKHNINYSWRLIMADQDVIDYIIVHELAHIKEHNHSAAFWSIVQSVMPDYQEKRKKLDLLQEKLNQQDWGE